MQFNKLLLSLSLAAVVVTATTVPVRSSRDLTSIEGRCDRTKNGRFRTGNMDLLRKWSFICSRIRLTSASFLTGQTCEGNHLRHTVKPHIFGNRYNTPDFMCLMFSCIR
ncbi:hypothetical protein B0H13DRAFT_1883814 [Mycena leptocephala]|nr:hypothetical protein B0H13DRAFT_1883814 [Mycena leptocephala]